MTEVNFDYITLARLFTYREAKRKHIKNRQCKRKRKREKEKKKYSIEG